MQCYTDCIMTLSAETTSSVEPRPSLRERKKVATRQALRRAALDLVSDRGFAHVTVEDIAEAADVSARTFFNYFPSKEAALFGHDPDHVEALRRRLINEAPGDTALEALRVVMVDQAREITEELAELGGDPADWLRRMKAAHADPQLRAARSTHMAMVESVVTSALAERLSTDPQRDPYPGLLACVAMGVVRSAISFWPNAGGSIALAQLTDSAFRRLAQGLPETGAAQFIDHREDDN
jgi:AcrR family transcriptional regulator